jgi:hypothetical protein
MIAKILAAGHMPLLIDNIRKSDVGNPNWYLSLRQWNNMIF